jgi:hypothetical protein
VRNEIFSDVNLLSLYKALSITWLHFIVWLCFIATAGVVKKCGMFKIVHEKYKKKGQANEASAEEFVRSFDFAIGTNKELSTLVNKVQVLQHLPS